MLSRVEHETRNDTDVTNANKAPYNDLDPCHTDKEPVLHRT